MASKRRFRLANGIGNTWFAGRKCSADPFMQQISVSIQAQPAEPRFSLSRADLLSSSFDKPRVVISLGLVKAITKTHNKLPYVFNSTTNNIRAGPFLVHW